MSTQDVTEEHAAVLRDVLGDHPLPPRQREAVQAAIALLLAVPAGAALVPVETLRRWSEATDRFSDADVPDTCQAHREIGSLIATVQPSSEAHPGYTTGQIDRTAPSRIWLQIDTGASKDYRDAPFPIEPEGVTWHSEEIGGLEIQYLRADLVAFPVGRDVAGAACGPQSRCGADAIDDVIAALRSSPCYCEESDGDGDAVTCDRCRALARLPSDKGANGNG